MFNTCVLLVDNVHNFIYPNSEYDKATICYIFNQLNQINDNDASSFCFKLGGFDRKWYKYTTILFTSAGMLATIAVVGLFWRFIQSNQAGLASSACVQCGSSRCGFI